MLREQNPLAAAMLSGSPRDSGGRSLVATRALEAGDTILTIPTSVLITAHRSGAIGGLQGQTELMWEAAGDLREEVGEELFERGATWDLRLALAVYEATAGAAGSFWDDYRKLMPPPPMVTHPLCLPESLLPELQNVEMQTKAREKAALFQALHPDLFEHESHPVTASYLGRAPMEAIPRPLPYAYALVVSRCFAMADGDTFAFVPFLDMAQHADTPSANFRVAEDGVTLTALVPLEKGDEVTLSYDPEYSSEQFFSQYGFVPCEGCAKDSKILRAIVAAANAAGDKTVAEATASSPATPLTDSQAGVTALLAAFDAHRESLHASGPRLEALFEVLLGELADDEAAIAPATLLAAVQWRQRELPTSLDEDANELVALETASANGEAVLPCQRAVLSYRLAIKKQLALTEAVLKTFLGR